MQKSAKRTFLLSVAVSAVVLTMALSVLMVVRGRGAIAVLFGREFADWVTMPGDIVQLPAGGGKDMYLYSSKGSIRFADSPAYPVYISVIRISDAGRDPGPERTISVESGVRYSLEFPLGPGEYQVVSSVAPQLSCCSESKYWNAFGPKFIIRKNGKSKTEGKPLIHRLRMTLLEPPNTADVKEKRPSLQWLPIEGASYYVVRWSCERRGCPKREVKTVEFQYVFAEDLRRGADYRWDVSAFNNRGEEIAYSAGSLFRTVE